ncbi:SIR2 family NAD-dependent protein deacylase [Pseudoduganella chitinolytica]|uniref:protein acetyllysine N-acetyltransferase n=1 Tax=Pseudoduganella chitinolytica TaxID=34070 RepID=A0ABY8BC16_9BURK|nr:Sir2 family NAD-dependent protein deacetylase [Pseudoduganella chitinolytica]WEF33450.1 NAD-dependent deacetylase [Pseudoduganella chitinolytica]
MTTDRPLSPALLDRAADLIAQADGLVVAAGAGMGVDSGLPDFRGDAGFWRAYPALGRARLAFTSVASPATFERDPALAWGFYGHRLALYRATVPHEGFALLRAWGERMSHGCHVFTSNVDGQFQRAGFDAQRVHECHGSIHHLQCLEACTPAIWPADGFVPDVDAAACRLRNQPPACPHCGGRARPNILMFGDWGWVQERSARQAARLQAWLRQVRRPVVIELGAGTAVPSVRYFSQQVVHGGGRLVRINPREWEVAGSRDVGLAAGALAGLRAIAARMRDQT